MNISDFDVLNRISAIINTEPGSNDASIARYLITHLRRSRDINVTAITREAFVTRSAVRRFCNRLGYPSLSALKDSFLAIRVSQRPQPSRSRDDLREVPCRAGRAHDRDVRRSREPCVRRRHRASGGRDREALERRDLVHQQRKRKPYTLPGRRCFSRARSCASSQAPTSLHPGTPKGPLRTSSSWSRFRDSSQRRSTISWHAGRQKDPHHRVQQRDRDAGL